MPAEPVAEAIAPIKLGRLLSLERAGVVIEHTTLERHPLTLGFNHLSKRFGS